MPSEPHDRHPRFLVREARLPIGDDYVIELDPGGRVYVVDGKLLRVRASLTIKDVDGAEVFHIQGTLLDVNNVLTISRDGATVATVRSRTPESGHQEYVVELPGSERRRGVTAARRIARTSLTYSGHVVAYDRPAGCRSDGGFRVQIMPGQDDSVVLAVIICLDVMSRHEREAKD